ncbi:MAG TPA: hypothetical protein VNM48_10260 [Chloroflexota bacterium]|nr:hypothetical protein [Chloroflexota bacterium]
MPSPQFEEAQALAYRIEQALKRQHGYMLYLQPPRVAEIGALWRAIAAPTTGYGPAVMVKGSTPVETLRAFLFAWERHSGASLGVTDQA